jgi:predicted nuclease of predicted toxin-antitoxin system
MSMNGLGGQPDEQIMALADRENRVLISADTDFGELLANAPVLAPSVILLRRTDKRAGSLAAVVTANPGRSLKTWPQAR